MLELLEQHRAAQIDQIKAYTFGQPTSDAPEPAMRRHALNAARTSLDEIDLALARLDAGTFGTCIRCALPIASQQLYAMPYARYCPACDGG